MTSSPPRRGAGRWGAALALLACTALAYRSAQIHGALPYPRHVDERALARPALKVLRTGKLHPGRLHKPALPIYLAAAGFAVGFLGAVKAGLVRSIGDVESVSYPYYSHRRIVRPARVLFAAAASLALVLAGVLAWYLSERASLLVVAPLVLLASPLVSMESWVYLNPDVVGCVFVLAACCVFVHPRPTRPGDLAWMGGAFAGLAIACKYNLAPILVTGLLAIWLLRTEDRLRASAAFLAAATLALLVAAPYTFLDYGRLLEDLARQTRAYGGKEAPPLRTAMSAESALFRVQLGLPSIAFAAIGLASLAVRSPARALVLASFPVGLLAFMGSFGLRFPRNLLAAVMIYGVVVALGLAVSVDALARRLGARIPDADRRRWARPAALVTVLAILGAGIPWGKLLPSYSLVPDSRNRIVEWIETHVPPGETLVVASELPINLGVLPSRHPVRTVPLAGGVAPPVGPSEAAWLVAPEYAGHPDAAGAAAANRLVPRIAGPAEVRFGSRPIWLGYDEPVPWGDPIVEVRRMKTAADAAGLPPDAKTGAPR